MNRTRHPRAAQERARLPRRAECRPALAQGWAFALVAACAMAAAVPALPQPRPDQPSAPTQVEGARQIAALGTNVPPGQIEARVQGVIHYISPASRRLYVQDGDLGVQVMLSGSTAAYQVGQNVRVTGTVLGGLSILRIAEAQAVVLGDAPLPEAPLTSIHALVRGQDSFRRVKVSGSVRDMYSVSTALVFLLTQGSYPFEVWFQTGNAELPEEWLDGEIEVTGFSYPIFNPSTGKPSGLRFHVGETNNVRVLAPGLAQRFDGRPLLSIADAVKLPMGLHARYRVSGVVTACKPGVAMFIDDGSGVLHVDLTLRYLTPPANSRHVGREPQTRVEPGDRVEVLGSRHNWFSLTPTLIQSEFRRLGRAEPVQPLPVALKDLKAGAHSGKLVTLPAQIIDFRKWGSSNLKQYVELVLRVDDAIFQAHWESETPANWDLAPDQYVRVTGVNDAEGGPGRQGTTFKLLMRSPGDVVPAPAPPFWARKDFQRAALAAGTVLLLASGWIAGQRLHVRKLERRVAERTAELARMAATARAGEAELFQNLAREKELSELKSRFVSMVSHEFRTPLAIITSTAEILDAYLDRLSADERQSHIRDITDATRHMSRLMEEVLLLGRVEAGKMACRPAPLDLPAFCQRLVDEILSATSNRCPIRLAAPPDCPPAVADEGLLRLILGNLIHNAVKYSPEGRPVDFSAELRGAQVQFTVRDQGIGIPASDTAHLFQAFHRGSNVGETPGTGLGMTIVKRCVELHGGRIDFESREAQGSTFRVWLPVLDPPDPTSGHSISNSDNAAQRSTSTVVTP